MRSKMTRFEKKTAEWLAKVTRCDTNAPVATSVMVSTICKAQLSDSSSTSRSSLLLAKTAANQKIARLLIRSFHEERTLEGKELDIQQKKEDHERKLMQPREDD